MQNSLYLLVIEHYNFYETKEFDTYVNWYIEDDCNVEFYIQEKPLLKFK